MEQFLNQLTNKKLKIIEFERKELEVKYSVYIFKENMNYIIKELGETEDGGKAKAILKCPTKRDFIRSLREYLKVIENTHVEFNYLKKYKINLNI